MSIDGNKEVVRKGLESVAKGDIKGIAAMYDENVVYHGAAGEEIQGSDALMEMIGGYLTAFPDMAFHLEDLVAEGDRVFSRVRAVLMLRAPASLLARTPAR